MGAPYSNPLLYVLIYSCISNNVKKMISFDFNNSLHHPGKTVYIKQDFTPPPPSTHHQYQHVLYNDIASLPISKFIQI